MSVFNSAAYSVNLDVSSSFLALFFLRLVLGDLLLLGPTLSLYMLLAIKSILSIWFRLESPVSSRFTPFSLFFTVLRIDFLVLTEEIPGVGASDLPSSLDFYYNFEALLGGSGEDGPGEPAGDSFSTSTGLMIVNFPSKAGETYSSLFCYSTTTARGLSAFSS